MSTHPLLRRQLAWKMAGLLLLGLLLLGAAPASADRLEKHFKVQARPVVTIHNPDGKVTVRAWTKSEVMVVAYRSSDKIEVEVDQTENRVDVMTHEASDTIAPDDMRTDLEISVPEDAELQIHNDSGAVSVTNVLGDMNVETVAAGVDLSDAAGYLTVKTVGGSFQCVRCAGRLEVSSSSGSFRFIDLRSYHVRAQTFKGNILFDGEFLPNGIYSLKNYSGVIEVRFSHGDSFDLSATSLKGSVNNQAILTSSSKHHFPIPKFGNALFGKFNAGRAKIDLSSFDGTINILKRE